MPVCTAVYQNAIFKGCFYNFFFLLYIQLQLVFMISKNKKTQAPMCLLLKMSHLTNAARSPHAPVPIAPPRTLPKGIPILKSVFFIPTPAFYTCANIWAYPEAR